MSNDDESERLSAAQRKLEEAIDELVKLRDDSDDSTTAVGYVLGLDNRYIDDSGRVNGYVSVIMPNRGQPVHVTKMILRESMEIMEMVEIEAPYRDDDE